MLTEVLLPLLVRWYRKGSVTRAFFVRYSLGGPHLRWRVGARDPALAQVLDAELEQAASRFFERHRSSAQWDAAAIREINTRLLADDPEAGDDEVIGDCQILRKPYRAETHRYGGEALSEATHALFTLSTLTAFDTVSEEDGSDSRWAKLAPYLSHVVGNCPGLGDLLRQLRPHEGYPGGAFADSLTKADTLFDRHPETLVDLLFETIERYLDGDSSSARLRLTRGANLLARHLDTRVSPDTRRHVLASHLHMTANRLGLSPAEEAFFARLAFLGAQRLVEKRPGWREFFAPPAPSGQDASTLLDALAAEGMDRLTLARDRVSG